MIDDANSPQEKALKINLNAVRFGTFAEIGAGQEVARWFFHAGNASATVARSISAYDMAVSDALYGSTAHYVSRERLESMLGCEYEQLVDQLQAKRGDRNAFFVFADTVATRGSSRGSGGHGWLGVRFQDQPGSATSDVIIHLEMLDVFTASQQETVGLVGVNLLHAAFTWHHDPVVLIRALMEGLDRRRVEIDMIKFSGPLFSDVDNRLMSLQLVEQGLTDAVMIASTGDVVQPAEILHGRAVLIERGGFRPITNVSVDMLNGSTEQFRTELNPPGQDPVVIMEMTLNNLMSNQVIDHEDFLARADILGAMAKTVMISNYMRFDSVTTYLRQYTQNSIGMVVGVPTLRAIFDEQYYQKVSGGILEGLGRLFQGSVRMFVYPTLAALGGELETADSIAIDPKLQHLYRHLLENGWIEPVRHFSREQLHVNPGEVLAKIQSGDESWVNFVPAEAAALIRRDGLFGCAKCPVVSS